MLTQPLMYKRIKAHRNVLAIYSDKLLKEGIIDEGFVKEVLFHETLRMNFSDSFYNLLLLLFVSLLVCVVFIFYSVVLFIYLKNE